MKKRQLYEAPVTDVFVFTAMENVCIGPSNTLPTDNVDEVDWDQLS